MNVRKVLVIGVKGSGKTDFIRKLAGKGEFDPATPTPPTGAIEKTFVQSTNVEIWDVSETAAAQHGEAALYAKDTNLAVFVLDAQGDYEAQRAYLLKKKDLASRAMLVVTKADNPKIPVDKFAALATELEVPTYHPCSAKEGTGFGVVGQAITAEIEHSSEEEKSPSPIQALNADQLRLAAIFDDAKRLVQDHKEENGGRANFIASIDHFKTVTLSKMTEDKITHEEAHSLAHKTKTLAHELISPLRNQPERQRAITRFQDETHPITAGCRYLTRAVGAVIGAAIGFAAGLFLGAGTGPGVIATALKGGTTGAKLGAAAGLAVFGVLTLWGTRNRNPERDEMVLQAEAYSNARPAVRSN